MFERLMNQICLMKEVAVDGTHTSEHVDKIEKHLIHLCYEQFDKCKIDIVQLRILLETI